jgi:hypothetical protein
MSDFDLQSVLRGLLNDDPVVDDTQVVEQVAEASPPCGDLGGGALPASEQEEPALGGEADLPGDAVPLIVTAPADEPDDVTTLVMNYPAFTEENLAETMDIRNYATLCKLKVRKWGGRVKDKKAARQSARDMGAVDGAYSTYKRLFAGVEDRLRAVNSVLDAARTRHYELTLPWSVTGSDDKGRRDGPRLMANTLFMEYVTEMGQAKQQKDQVLAELERAYPSMLVEAKKNLGNGFDIKQYPTSAEIKDYFDLEFEFMPVPLGVDYKGLPRQQIGALANKLNKSMQQCMENALRDVWARLYSRVQKMQERLSNPKHIFHDTLVSNMRELAATVEHLNATKDPRIENIRKQIEANLCRFEAEDLRKDLTKRALTAQLAGEILRDMEASVSRP